ncbi:hypothetical protein [Pseudomonas fluorescens]|nr:hypothetical protein [Pseudomonas fluorescens]
MALSAFGDELSAFGDALETAPPSQPVPQAQATSAFGDPLSSFGDPLEAEPPAPKTGGMAGVLMAAQPQAAPQPVPSAQPQLPNRTAGQWVTDAGVSVGKTAYNAFDSLAGLGDVATGGAVTPWLAEHGMDSKAARAALDAELSPQARAQQQEVANAKGFGPTVAAMLQNPAYTAGQVVESVGPMVLGGVAGKGVALGARAAGLNAGRAALVGAGAGEGLLAAGQQAAQTVQQTGTLTPGQSGLALLSGGLTGLLGMAGARIGRKLGVADIDAQMAGANSVDVAKGYVNRALTGTGIESLEELTQSGQQQVLTNLATDRPALEGVDKQMAMGGVLGGVMGMGAALRSPNTPAPAPVPMAQPVQQAQGMPMPTPAPATSPIAAQASAPQGLHASVLAAMQGQQPAPGPAIAPAQNAPPAAPASPPMPREFAGSRDVAPLFRSMGMDQAQMDKSLELLRDVEPDIQAARRGTISWEETGQLAALTGTTVEKLRKHRVGVAFNAEEQVAATRLLKDQTLKTLELGNKISTGMAGEIDQANFLQALADLRTTQKAVMSSRAEIGRAMSAMRADVTTMKDASRLIESAGSANGVKAIADALTTAARVGGVEAANKMARASGSDAFWTFYKSALLSSPDTHIVNMVSNLFTSGLQVPTRLLAGGIGAAKRLATGGKAGETRMGEAGYQLAGMLEGSINGAKGAVESWRTGADAFGDSNKAEIYRSDYPGQQVWGTPLRLLQSEDAFFKNLNDGMERYSVAYRMAAQELKGQGTAAVHKRVQELIANPPKELVEAGHDAALFHTFNNNAGRMTQAVNNWRHALPYGTGNIVIPFLRTPANLITYAVKHTPAAAVFKEVRADIKAGGAKQEEAFARMGIGSLLISLGAVGALNGSLSGGGPEDPKERKAWLAAGNQPYSLLVNGKWHAYNRIEPLASLIGIAADVATGAENQALGMASIFKAIGRNFTSKTWLQGLSGVMQAMTDPDRYGASFVNRAGATLVQPATLLSHIGRYGDPYQRATDKDSFLDQLKYRLPGETLGRESLPIKHDHFGQPMMEAERQIGRAGPIPIATPSDDPVRLEAARLGWMPGAMQSHFSVPVKGQRSTRYDLTDDQLRELNELAGARMHAAAGNLMRTRYWESLNDDERQDALDKIMKDARGSARVAFVPYLNGGKRGLIDLYRKQTSSWRQTHGGKK